MILRPVQVAALVVAVTLALAAPARAATEIACLDAAGQPQTVSPQHPCATRDGMLNPVAGSQEGLTVASATALTVPAGATIALVTVEGATVRYRCDGTAPTASAGSLLAIGSVTRFNVNPLSACKFIQTTTTATLDVEFFN